MPYAKTGLVIAFPTSETGILGLKCLEQADSILIFLLSSLVIHAFLGRQFLQIQQYLIPVASIQLLVSFRTIICLIRHALLLLEIPGLLQLIVFLHQKPPRSLSLSETAIFSISTSGGATNMTFSFLIHHALTAVCFCCHEISSG